MESAADFDALKRHAEAGDATAQYRLAAALSRAGRRSEADRWLQSSAQNGFADAIYTLATREIMTAGGAMAVAPQLERAAAKGSTAAIRLLAVLRTLSLSPQPTGYDSLAEVIAVARSGDAPASVEISCLLAQLDPDSPAIAALLQQAGTREPVSAAFCLARAAAGRQTGRKEFLDDCAAYLEKCRYPRAGVLVEAMKETSAPPQDRMPEIDWDRLAIALKSRPAPLPAAERLCKSPDMVIHRGAVAPEVCEYVIAHAASRLGPSLVYNPKTDGMIRDPLRTSATASLSPINLDLALIALNRTMAIAAQSSDENGEFLSVLRYAPGQEYRPHIDCIPRGKDFDASGQRVKTALLFLNDDFEGGETHFLTPDIKIRGRRGDILIFSNVLADGEPDKASRHAGLPVAVGEKWLASRWFRARKFKF